MTTLLPLRPDLAQLKRLAKELLRAHQLGDDTVCPSLRTLLRFDMATDAEILAADIKLHDVQFALARGYGFSSWDALKHHIERITMTAIVEGKTKVIRSGPSDASVYLETKDCLTGGDAARREVITDIGLDKTIQAANVFALLQKNGLPVSFIEQASPRELLCHRCDMLPLELVVRRFAWGSFLLRHPEYRTADNSPIRFDEPYCEFFHKHAVVSKPIADTPYQMIEDDARQQFLHDGVWAKGVYTDPFLQAVDEQWIIYPAKESLAEAQPLMRIEPLCSQEEYQQIIDSLMIPAFLVLEEAWKEIETAHGPVALVDMKLEVGRRQSDNRIVIADVIDNDSWRIWPGGNPNQQLDKQCFRDGDSLVNVAEKYSVVTMLTNQFLR